MTPLTADELVILIKARDLLHDKRNTGNNLNSHRVTNAHAVLVDVLRYSFLDTRDEAPK